jgi:hypothetical protein
LLEARAGNLVTLLLLLLLKLLPLLLALLFLAPDALGVLRRPHVAV